MSKKIFVTGGAGFIGSHIVESLVKKNYDVTVYDDFSSGHKEYLKEVINDIRIIDGDILDYEKLKFSMRGFDFVSHHAAQLEIVLCLRNPVEDLKTNTIGTINVLQASVENKIKKVMNASSACVYGQARSIPEKESDHPTNPNWAYGVSKLASEKYCEVYRQTYGLQIVNLRYAIIYGPREWYGRVLTMFVKRVLEDRPPVIFGDGNQIRDFTYVGDAVEIHNRALENENANGKVYNVSTGLGTTIKDLAYKVIELSGKKLEPVFEEVREGDYSSHIPHRVRLPMELRQMVLDNQKASLDLGWRPQTPLSIGLRYEYEWLQDNLGMWKGLRI
jgi:nucleoside-diphosphate-sugar epimerase